MIECSSGSRRAVGAAGSATGMVHLYYPCLPSGFWLSACYLGKLFGCIEHFESLNIFA